MAYENQNKCLGCGISIPFVHEDADSEASYCDKCLEEEDVQDRFMLNGDVNLNGHSNTPLQYANKSLTIGLTVSTE